MRELRENSAGRGQSPTRSPQRRRSTWSHRSPLPGVAPGHRCCGPGHALGIVIPARRGRVYTPGCGSGPRHYVAGCVSRASRRTVGVITVNQSLEHCWLAGVDGCPVGWMVVFTRQSQHEGSTEFHLRLLARFADILSAHEAPAVIAVDIPIGLPAEAGRGGRAAENMVRPLLGERQSSVFSVPSRAALEQAEYREACAVALATSQPPRKISRQLFNIAPKIREVDALLRADPGAAARVFEVHPELAFWRLNGGRALEESKKVKGRCYAPGLALRRRLLLAAGIPPEVVHSEPPDGAGPDDLLDALACSVIAGRIGADKARPFPDPPERDAFGLPMAIWA